MEEKEIIRSSEQACREIEVLTKVLDLKVGYPKFNQMNKQGQTVQGEVITGSFECSPFNDNEILLIKGCILALTQQYINKDENLVRYKKAEVKPEENKEAVKEQPDSKTVE